MLEKFLKTIEENKLIKKGDKIVVGVSGGPDSVCLLHLLHEIKDDFSLELIIAHVNYGTRGEDSDGDEEYVRMLSQKMELHCKVLKDTRYKIQDTKNLEEAYRNIRYSFFENIFREEKADSVAVAHTLDDQVETILMFFIRGSGLRGLSGMEYKKDNVIRPLLDISKKEVLAYLKEKKLEYRTDITNEDIKFTRNKIRHKLIPYLEKEFNPSIKSTLVKNAEVIGDDYDFISKSARDIYTKLAQKDKEAVKINIGEFFDLNRAVQRELVRLILKYFIKDIRGISVLDVNELLRVLKEGRSGSFRDIKGLRFLKKDGNIVISLIKNAN